MTKLFFRILDRDAHADYIWLLLICSFPVGLAWFLGIHQSYPSSHGTYVGYLDKANFWPLAVAVPAVLWLVRREMGRIANLTAPDLSERVPALIELFDGDATRQVVYRAMRAWMGSPRVIGSVLAITILITALDMRELLSVYILNSPARESELDWTLMYQIGVIPKAYNLLFVASAYLVQFIITLLAIFSIFFMLFHNLFFISRIYQRRNVTPGQENNYIRVKLDDVNKCFGFRVANEAFNTQVTMLIWAGLVIFLSRFSSVSELEAELNLTELFIWPSPIFERVTIPDMGQLLLVFFWVLGLGIVLIPAIVKLLPRLPIGNTLSNPTITTYLKEFLDDSAWRYGDDPSKQEIDFVAAQFAENSFWPTGDNRASQLFFFSAMIFLIILFPIKTNDVLVLVLSLAVMSVVAWSLKGLFFVVLKKSLSFIDERLATVRPDVIAAMGSKPKLRKKLFISYRRDDSKLYTRLLHQSLLKFMDASNIFIDIETIKDGEDFVTKIEQAVQGCGIMLAVIGPDWLLSNPESGEKRIFEAGDFVRLEIAIALKAECLVVPVLVGNAKMPGADDLPADLQPLWRRNARVLSDSHWDYDVEELVKSLSES